MGVLKLMAVLLLTLAGCTTKLSFEFSTMKQWDRPAESTMVRTEDTSTLVKSPPKSEVITPAPVIVTPSQ